MTTNTNPFPGKLPGTIVSVLLLLACISCTTAPEAVTPETALQSYLQNEDASFAWNVKGSYLLDDLTVYDLRLTSQQWREHIWKHTLTIIVPEKIKHDGALLFITGGKNKDGEPIKRGGDDEFIQSMARVAEKKLCHGCHYLANSQPATLRWYD